MSGIMIFSAMDLKRTSGRAVGGHAAGGVAPLYDSWVVPARKRSLTVAAHEWCLSHSLNKSTVRGGARNPAPETLPYGRGSVSGFFLAAGFHVFVPLIEEVGVRG